MAEGPQILLRTRWLHAHTAGKTPSAIRAFRPELEPLAAQLQALPIRQVACRGKLLWFEFDSPEGPILLQNQLLMDGRWRRHAPNTPLPPTAWLAFEFEDQTIANHEGQLFRISNPAELQERLAKLGPDVMTDPYPAAQITTSLQRSKKPIAEALLDQTLLCGIGNTAKSESLFLARQDPRAPANTLTPNQFETLNAALLRVTRDAITDRGRWRRRVYQRAAEPCPNCRTPITHLRQSNRDTFACPRCQSLDPTLTPPPNFRLGCAIWAFPGWVGPLYPKGTNSKTFLHRYGERLTAVEGNVTFYTRPATELLNRWRDATPEPFHFVPKLPRDVTHNEYLAPFANEAREFLEHMQTMGPRLGPVFAQLPGTYGPSNFEDLKSFLTTWPHDKHPLLLEVRHPDWFEAPDRGRLVALLNSLSIGKVHLDTRPIFECDDNPQAHSQRRKPQLPVHPSDAPSIRSIVRYISHPILERNEPYLAEWAEVVTRWLRAGRQVWFFAHCPTEEHSPRVARRFQELLEAAGAPVPALPWNAIPPEPRQAELF